MIVIYISKSNTRNYIYIRMTDDLIRRLDKHNAGYNKTTKPFSPFELIHEEEFNNRT